MVCESHSPCQLSSVTFAIKLYLVPEIGSKNFENFLDVLRRVFSKAYNHWAW